MPLKLSGPLHSSYQTIPLESQSRRVCKSFATSATGRLPALCFERHAFMHCVQPAKRQQMHTCLMMH